MSVFTFEATGTRWEIETPRPLDRRLQTRLLERVEAFEMTYSRFRPDSLVSQMAAAPTGGRFAFPDDAVLLFALYDQLHAVTGGAVDPLVGRDLELLGYDPAYSLTPAPDDVRAADPQARWSWAQDVVRTGATLVTRRPLVLDVGAVGKGYLVDLLAGMLGGAGVEGFVVDGSGDLRHAGAAGLQVGLEHPFDRGLVIGVANLHDQALCASAVNRRAWGDGLHHVLDGRSGRPVQGVVATWVVADDAATADGLATALFFTGAAALAPHFTFSSVRLFQDARAEVSEAFDGELFT